MFVVLYTAIVCAGVIFRRSGGGYCMPRQILSASGLLWLLGLGLFLEGTARGRVGMFSMNPEQIVGLIAAFAASPLERRMAAE